MKAMLKHLFRDPAPVGEWVLMSVIGGSFAGAHIAFAEYFKPYETTLTSRFLMGAAPFAIAFFLGRAIYYWAFMRRKCAG